MKTSPNDIVLKPPMGPVDRTVCLPGSKSLTNRALVIAALASGESTLEGILLADDTRCMMTALGELGMHIEVDEERRTAVVPGCAGHLPSTDADLFCQNAGTVIRFLTPVCAAGFGECKLTGTQRMHERPIGPLVAALRELGGQVGFLDRDGFPPLHVRGKGLRGGRTTLDAEVSSQFLSALLIAAPLALNDVMIELRGELPSEPYVAMTIDVMDAFGVQVVEDEMRKFIVPAPQQYEAEDYEIEPDASAASYFFAAAAVTGGRITVEGLGLESCQGDLAFVDVLERMGCRVEQGPRHTTVWGPKDGALRGVDADLQKMPDVAPTLAVVAAFAEGPTHIRNVPHIRHKETDRLAALSAELSALGVASEVLADGISILPDKPPTAGAIRTYEDHRMAMSFAIAGLRLEGLVIRDADCVSKTFPEFFELWRDMA
ncbi:MAG TPA: 3-phosphoshikimate 1-carboxyvinyltransferase [Phycisphaerae bacterium]|nr:3-phosphoshikimate 1-carboxyvinyltransferase [Phycisphaerae bacterium]